MISIGSMDLPNQNACPRRLFKFELLIFMIVNLLGLPIPTFKNLVKKISYIYFQLLNIVVYSYSDVICTHRNKFKLNTISIYLI